MAEAGVTARHRFTRLVRRQKALLVLLALALILVALVAGCGIWLQTRLSGVERFPVGAGPEQDRPALVQSKAVDFLVVGADDPSGKGGLFPLLRSGTWRAGAYRSDALMIAHLSADRRELQFISIPRDSYVPVPGHGHTKINAAFSYGGPSLLVRTVESLTRIRIDHVAVVDFRHFSSLVDALGGVDVTMLGDTHPTHLDGGAAYSYVRTRKTLPHGDLDRVQRQQNVLRAVFRKLLTAGTLANPLKTGRLVDSLDRYLAVDDSLTAGLMRSLGISSRHLRWANIRFATVPVTGTPTIAGASVVTLDVRSTRSLFAAVADDAFDTWSRTGPADELPAPAAVN